MLLVVHLLEAAAMMSPGDVGGLTPPKLLVRPSHLMAMAHCFAADKRTAEPHLDRHCYRHHLCRVPFRYPSLHRQKGDD